MLTPTTTEMIPVYKFHAAEPWRFFYSTNSDDDAIRVNWTRDRQAAFYAYKTKVSGTVPVYRFVSTTAPFRYQYSTQISAAGPGWKNEGAAFYAFPSRSDDNVAVLQYCAIAADGGWRYQYVSEQYAADPTNGVSLQGWKSEGPAFYAPIYAICGVR